jgi:hypothetical protein
MELVLSNLSIVIRGSEKPSLYDNPFLKQLQAEEGHYILSALDEEEEREEVT